MSESISHNSINNRNHENRFSLLDAREDDDYFLYWTNCPISKNKKVILVPFHFLTSAGSVEDKNGRTKMEMVRQYFTEMAQNN